MPIHTVDAVAAVELIAASGPGRRDEPVPYPEHPRFDAFFAAFHAVVAREPVLDLPGHGGTTPPAEPPPPSPIQDRVRDRVGQILLHQEVAPHLAALVGRAAPGFVAEELPARLVERVLCAGTGRWLDADRRVGGQVWVEVDDPPPGVAGFWFGIQTRAAHPGHRRPAPSDPRS
jgi:hypothetical protein